MLPPPTSGTITIKKDVVGTPDGEHPSFPFNGSISFDPGGFTLGDGQSKDFYRAGGSTWDVTEGAVQGFKLESVNCTATAPGGGPASSTTTVDGATTSIDLVDGEHVTCVYTNRYRQPAGGLTIDKLTRGGIGAFAYTVAPDGGGTARHAVATTTEVGVPDTAEPSLDDLSPGGYTITERSPQLDTGRWHTVRVVCDGARLRPGRPVHVTISSGRNSHCTFVNLFVPAGSISLSKITRGATGSVLFAIGRKAGAATQYIQHATTVTEGVAADATPVTPSDATDHLRLGRYLIVEQSPPSDPSDSWSLEAVVCNGQLVPFDRGGIQVTLTSEHPSVHCVFTDVFSSHPEPPPLPPPVPPTPPTPPPPPTPTPPAPPVPVPPYPVSDLNLSKRALTPVVPVGQVAAYALTVRNAGQGAAERVVLADKPRADATVVSVRPSSGHCRVTNMPDPLILCSLGNIAAGAHASIVVRMIPKTTQGEFVNVAAVGSATDDHTLSNNRSRAVIRVVHPPAPPVVCPSARQPRAHAAC